MSDTPLLCVYTGVHPKKIITLLVKINYLTIVNVYVFITLVAAWARSLK
jgi:hypothetical protein